MKLILAASTAVLLCFNVASAQIKYGVTAGLNLANIVGDNTDGNAMKAGFHAGLAFDFSLSDNVLLSPAVLYSTKGTQDDKESKYKLNTNYVEIPVLVKYQLDNGLNFGAGPYLGLLMSAKSTDGTDDIDVKDLFASTDYGLKAGIGYSMESGLGFGLNYGLGLANILDKELADLTDSKSTNAVIGVSISYLLGGK